MAATISHRRHLALHPHRFPFQAWAAGGCISAEEGHAEEVRTGADMEAFSSSARALSLAAISTYGWRDGYQWAGQT